MHTVNADLRVILIGGTSHTGKSTLAQSLADDLGWHYVSTDSLARHPGRPWRRATEAVPAHVAEHYLSMTVPQLVANVRTHYLSMWPTINALIEAHALDPTSERLVLEGSALWPESVATVRHSNVGAIWLTASDAGLRERIHRESDIDRVPDAAKTLINQFVGRAQLFNVELKARVEALRLPSVDVDATGSPEHVAAACMRLLAVKQHSV